jgi:hypothetical protein
MKRTLKVVTFAFTWIIFLFPLSNLVSVFGQTLEGTSASSTNDDNNNNTIFQRTGNTTNTTAGGLSASSVGNSTTIASDRIGNSASSVSEGENS